MDIPTQPTRSISEETRDLADHASHYVNTLRQEGPFGRTYDENPYLVIGAAAGLGYLLAGGLFTPFSKRIVRMGLRALVIPLAISQVKQLSSPDTLSTK